MLGCGRVPLPLSAKIDNERWRRREQWSAARVRSWRKQWGEGARRGQRREAVDWVLCGRMLDERKIVVGKKLEGREWEGW
jgi:hypothetical protein